MKILFISIQALHTSRWIENLKDSNHELYWLNVSGKGNLEINSSVKQITNWEKRKLPYLKGEHYVRKNQPKLYEKIQSILELTVNEKLEEILLEIKPDLVHSFEMFKGSYPILKTMMKFPKIKWLYSCWGSDFFKYENSKAHVLKIKNVLDRLDYLHTDCERDYQLALKYGFEGDFCGVIPGGGGFYLGDFQKYIYPVENRNIILVKGYQHHVGRGLQIIKALAKVPNIYTNFKVIVFGTHQSVKEYILDKKLPFEVFGRHDLKHDKVLELMGKSLIYIGNSTSDGLPNTLLESIIMGAFPIQSNPGAVTAEIISNNKNGFLIEDPEDVDNISELIVKAINNPALLQNAFSLNQIIAQERLDYNFNQQKIVDLYHKIESDL